MLERMIPTEVKRLVESNIRLYIMGVRHGIRMYAHWKDGTQYVGTTGKTLKEALKEWETDEP